MYVILFLQFSEVDTPFVRLVYMKKAVNIHGKRHAYQFGLYQTGPFVPLPSDPTIRTDYGRYMCNAIIIYVYSYIYAAT